MLLVTGVTLLRAGPQRLLPPGGRGSLRPDGIGQLRTAALLGVTDRTVRRWVEGGVVTPPAMAIERLAGLARAFGSSGRFEGPRAG